MAQNPRVVVCPKHPCAPHHLIRTPDLIHYAKWVCLECGRFLKWEPKPKKEEK